jgi:curved DNA-binding protein CbpA
MNNERCSRKLCLFWPGYATLKVSRLLLSIANSMTENHYRTLGVAPTAELDAIKQAYRQQIRLYHPDTFASRRSEIQRMGDTSRLLAIEKEIENAKTMTQRINAAYAVLSDADARAKYDQQVARERQAKQESRAYEQRMRASDDGRRTVKARPHRPRSQKPSADAAPWALGVAFFFFLFIASAYLTNTVFRQEQIVITVDANRQARQGEVGMNDLQSTTNSRQATRIARATIASLPSLTPRSPEDNEALGDSMMALGQYHLAIESYSAVLRVFDDTRLYAKRGLAYSAAFFAGVRSHAALAIADFDEAIRLDNENALAYRGRGWLFYQLWLRNSAAEDADAAQADFEMYLELVETDSEIEAALLELAD